MLAQGSANRRAARAESHANSLSVKSLMRTRTSLRILHVAVVLILLADCLHVFAGELRCDGIGRPDGGVEITFGSVRPTPRSGRPLRCDIEPPVGNPLKQLRVTLASTNSAPLDRIRISRRTVRSRVELQNKREAPGRVARHPQIACQAQRSLGAIATNAGSTPRRPRPPVRELKLDDRLRLSNRIRRRSRERHRCEHR